MKDMKTLDAIDQVSLKKSIFRIGLVFSVDGLEVKVKVDKEKNSPYLLYKGALVKNISVNGYVKILKGFISIIAKVSGEYIKEEKIFNKDYNRPEDRIERILQLQLLGYIDEDKFERGIKELPLIDNECYLLDLDEFEKIHDFVSEDDLKLKIGTLSLERGHEINVGVNSLFASHIGIFGNTGSGKSYTLAKLYRQLFKKFRIQEKFNRNAKFILFDFNGEYSRKEVIVEEKKVYNLNTRSEEGEDRIPLSEADIFDIELFSIMANATEKTQKPFLDRSLKFYKKVMRVDDPLRYFKNTVRKSIKSVLAMSDKIKSQMLLDYLRSVVPKRYDDFGIEVDLLEGVEWHGNKHSWYKSPYDYNRLFGDHPEEIEEVDLYKEVDKLEFNDNPISRIITFLYLQLIKDLLSNRAQNEHISPAINKLKAFKRDFDKVIEITEDDFWDMSNFVVVNLDKVNLLTKKTIPLLLSHKLYSKHKELKTKLPKKSLNIIIDEAHNILSYTSQRESDSWKDYRLETFEEIIKEGRKFGVFLTVASQRPSDISATIISQLHNYFIHRLINERDLEAISRTVSYLDKASHNSLSILPTGTCVFAGLTAQVPVIIDIDPIEEKQFEPDNRTINLLDNWLDKKVKIKRTK